MKKPTLAVLITLVIVLWITSGIGIAVLASSTERAGQFGDMFGAVNALFAGLAFAGLIYTIQLQKEELGLQRQELADTREELKGQKEQLARQNETMQRQQFEATFFQTLSLHNQMVSSLQAKDGAGRQALGRDVFSVRLHYLLKEMYNDIIKKPNLTSDEDQLNEAFRRLYIQHGNLLGHYFKILYNLVKLVDRSTVNDKRFYTNLIRAQLSDHELVILFYDGLSEYGRDKLKPLIEKYALLKHVSDRLLLHSKHRSFYDFTAFGS